MVNKLRMPRWNDVLLAIYKSQDSGRYCQRLNRRVKGSLTHLRDIVQALARQKLIEVYNQKKIKRIRLTEKGQRVAVHILKIKCVLS